jgi:diguanylate cyclase (GGDEF)-like protein/PAS domain S-box-containing protein
VAVERDITSRKESELEMLRLNRALRLLSACSDVLIRTEDETQLVNEICKLAVDIGGYRMAWVGYSVDDENKSIMPVGSYGDKGDFLDKLKLSWAEDNLRGMGPGGKTIRHGKTIVVEDIANDPTYPAIKEAVKKGYLALISLPLLDKKHCFGLLAMYAPEVRNIPAEEIRLLEEMAEDLSFGILNIRAKLEQQRIQTAVTKVATSVSLTATNQFFEQLVQSMIAATDADAGFIAKIISDEPLIARTLVAEVDGKSIENIEYDLTYSPCRHLMKEDHFVLSESVAECFNPSQTMISLGMKDYIGQRLVNSQGKVIGMIFVMRREVRKHNEFTVSTLKIFATRAAAEIERQDYDRHIRNQASLLDKAQDAIVVWSMDHHIQFWNKGAERLYGWMQDEVMGKSMVDLIYSDKAEFLEAKKVLLSTGEWSKEVTQQCKDGRRIFAEAHWTLVTDDKGQPLSVLCINTDVTQRKTAAAEIQYLAFYDQLTNLANRSLMQDRLQHAIATSIRTGKYGALLYIDIDNFKTINDTMGHAAGDTLLKAIARRLLENTRDSDSVARLGGDEFIIILEELSIDSEEAAIQSKTFAEKLIEIFQEPFEIEQHKHHSTPSIGITLFHDDLQTVSELLQQADLAMYQAKASGRNTLRFYDPQMQTVVTYRAELEDNLRVGLKNNEFLLHYQPQFDSESRCIGAEVLLRWVHPTKGMISPAQFIPLAEETLLILPIGEWVLQTACETLLKWQEIPQMANMTLAVNVSVNQFRQVNFLSQVITIIEKSGINPAMLKLELTESLFAENTQDIIAKMIALRELGVTFSLDDFGTGYSSLYYLKRMPLDQLKIDQSFVREILTDNHDATICRSIITLAQSLGLEVIAEGVETIEQKEFLRKEGCHLYQGYYFSKPLPIDELERLIVDKDPAIKMPLVV